MGTEESPESAPLAASGELPETPPAQVAANPTAPELAEVPIAAPTETDAELYQDVPSLITATQIREAMTALAAELRAALREREELAAAREAFRGSVAALHDLTRREARADSH